LYGKHCDLGFSHSVRWRCEGGAKFSRVDLLFGSTALESRLCLSYTVFDRFHCVGSR
jgi:hypothetical protein